MKLDQNSIIRSLKEFIKKNNESILKDYFTFLRYPTVSSEPEYKPAMAKCADWLVNYLKSMGFETQVWKEGGHPIIFASHCRAGEEKPTLLIYNHYDVQPVDPLEEWASPPFEPTRIDGEVYARGAQDNKGQCFYVLQAIKLFLELHGSLPINIKLCIEGEEEMGSAHLSSILSEKEKELRADYLAIVDLGLRDPKVPAITLGIRGLVTMEVEAIGSEIDLHSGSHGGIVVNPIHALVSLLARLRDDQGRITVPGFYDQVREISLEEKAQVSFNFDAIAYKNIAQALPEGGEKEFSALERAWIRPTLEINGIQGGYTGKGFKTVIPAKAHAKISCRLVPDQDPQKIGELVVNYLYENAPPGIEIRGRVLAGGGRAVRVGSASKVAKAFAMAFEEVFDVPCEFILEGASIPIVTELAEASGAEVILMGLGLASDQIHAPNERFGEDRIQKGILIMARGFELLGYFS
jgi:acetylornithine deacetylase/succinyl-diaminopimelate desuccinylase-like protein